jgi:peptidyl-tRNA hydrolase, PTH1 family
VDISATDAPSLRVIVGLGNPGENYRDTRHNIGFMVLDEVARRLGLTFQSDKRWNTLVARHESCWLLKPQTYMNDSGRAVAGLNRFFKVTPQETLVVYDDVDLPLGAARFRGNGSAAGHNGIKSLISHLSTADFPRLKLGIATESGRPSGDRMVGHVLGKFTADEQAPLAIVVDQAADAIITALQKGLSAAMNVFNRK